MGKEEEFERRIVGEYLKYGSVEEVFKRNRYNLPISVAGFYKLLDRWGVVRAAGPNNKLSEAIDFLEQLAFEKIPLERLYKKLPPSFQTSAVTLHRILSHVKRGVTRRCATALIITHFDDNKRILVGRDVSAPRLEYGKYYGAYSIPMTFSKRKETRERAILRVLQQEVFSKRVVERKFPDELIPKKPKPFVFFDIADIRLSVFHIRLPENLNSADCLESYKLVDFQFVNSEEIGERRNEFRVGVREVIRVYERNLDLLNRGVVLKPKVVYSDLNISLLEIY